LFNAMESDFLPGRLDAERASQDVRANAEIYQESVVLTRIYERCREGFLLAQAAFAELNQARARGQFSGPEHSEFRRRASDFLAWAKLALRIADAEVGQRAWELTQRRRSK
jgi:hypothetical protein